ncbi:MAG: 5'/3'-nucleotidase SurE [Desulfobacterales bacterium]|nr:MAG: 5'/3'-nucleotidase SurE [Desulfobacterales bacterium]
MNILLTNDDGIYAKGLWALYERFSARYSVTVVAPDRERSAVSHGITLHQPLRATRVKMASGYHGYAVNGTPTDCIKISLMEILNQPPDLVISGINLGANVGVNLNYSGTVAAAKEASIYKLPAMAVSIKGHQSGTFDDAALFTAHLAEIVQKHGLPMGTMLNVNIPDMPINEIKGVRISKQGTMIYSEFIEKRIDPRNRAYYWHGHDTTTSSNNPEFDVTALAEDFISITPIQCDMTDYRLLEDLKRWNIDIRTMDIADERGQKNRAD